MPKYIVDMDEPNHCDHCLFIGRGVPGHGRTAMCNITGTELKSTPPEHWGYDIPKNCPLEEIEWEMKYWIEFFYEAANEWKSRTDLGEFDDLAKAIGECVLALHKPANADVTNARVMECLEPPRSELMRVAWESEPSV